MSGCRGALLTAALAGALVAGCGSGGRRVAPSPVERYEWRLPAGFPLPPVPESNPMSAAKVELGRRLFYDRRLSINGDLSCGGCHRQELAFTDGRARAVGATGELHPRGAMSLANVAYNPTFNWADPEVVTLEQQMRTPLSGRHPIELGLGGRERDALLRLAADPAYPELFRRAFPGRRPSITLTAVIEAIAAFERTLLSGDSPYDRYVFWGETDRFGAAAQRGMKLFFSERLACGACHGGLHLAGPLRFAGGPPAQPAFHNTGLYNLDGRGDYPEGGRGLVEVTGDPSDMGRFRPPSLRNVALTAPYMHDGSVATLDEVIDHYAAGGRSEPPNPFRSPLLTGFELEPGERSDLLVFLASLTDRGFVTDPRFSDPFAQKLNEAPRE